MDQPHYCTPHGVDSHSPHELQGCNAFSTSNNSNTSCATTGDNSSSSSSGHWSTHSRLFSFLVLLHSFQVAVGTAEASAAPPGPPCVACDDCVTSSCLRICMPSCRTAPTIAEGSDLSTEQCKHKGQDAALDIATAACKLSQAVCQVTSKAPARFASVATVSGSQCAALASAGCQHMASSSTYSPCGANQYFGHSMCSGRQFREIYRVKVGELCLAAVHNVG